MFIASSQRGVRKLKEMGGGDKKTAGMPGLDELKNFWTGFLLEVAYPLKMYTLEKSERTIKFNKRRYFVTKREIIQGLLERKGDISFSINAL